MKYCFQYTWWVQIYNINQITKTKQYKDARKEKFEEKLNNIDLLTFSKFPQSYMLFPNIATCFIMFEIYPFVAAVWTSRVNSCLLFCNQPRKCSLIEMATFPFKVSSLFFQVITITCCLLLSNLVFLVSHTSLDRSQYLLHLSSFAKTHSIISEQCVVDECGWHWEYALYFDPPLAQILLISFPVWWGMALPLISIVSCF